MQRVDRSTAGRAVRATARTERRFEHGPLGVGHVHAVEYDGDHTEVSGGFRIYETASGLSARLRALLSRLSPAVALFASVRQLGPLKGQGAAVVAFD